MTRSLVNGVDDEPCALLDIQKFSSAINDHCHGKIVWAEAERILVWNARAIEGRDWAPEKLSFKLASSLVEKTPLRIAGNRSRVRSSAGSSVLGQGTICGSNGVHRCITVLNLR